MHPERLVLLSSWKWMPSLECHVNVCAGATINIVNDCSGTTTACAQQGSNPIDCFVLNGGGGSQLIDVGTSWPAGAIWGFPGSGNDTTGTDARPQADLAEFTIGGSGGEDFYDISNVNAYNEAIAITVSIVPGDAPSGTTHCQTDSCSIANITSFCQSPNTLTGAPGDGYFNTDGPNVSQPTNGTIQFKNACPNAFSYTNDTVNTQFTCGTGSNYSYLLPHSLSWSGNSVSGLQSFQLLNLHVLAEQV